MIRRQFKTATAFGKHMHVLVNKENTFATPLNNPFLDHQNNSKLLPPLANTCIFLLTSKAIIATP
jgi:hypothetical protein